MQRQQAGLAQLVRSQLTTAEVPRRKLPGAGSARPHAGSRYDRYELIHPVADGGMATVWLARTRGKHGFERLVALKAILPSFARDSRFRDMFLDEARIASRIEHANVARIFDVGESDGNLYLVMEWVDGDSLANLLRVVESQGRAFPIHVLLRIFAEVCAGLHAAHELRDQRGQSLNVVHRDVSPQNILVTDTGVVKVIDFGVVQARGRIAEDTTTGVVKGKLHYVAPERALGAEVDRRADLWAIGAVLYRCLAGRHAHDGHGDLAIVRALVAQNQIAPLPSSVPRALSRMVYKALARDPRDRYESAAELQRELENFLHRLPTVTTSSDVAGFVMSTLGPTLASRRTAIARALEREEETATLRFSRSHIALVPPVPRLPAESPPESPARREQPVRSLQVVPSPLPVKVERVLLPTVQQPAAPGARSAARPRSTASAAARGTLRRLTLTVGAGTLAVLAVLLGQQLASLEAPPAYQAASPAPSRPTPHAATAEGSRAKPLAQSLQEPKVFDVNDLALERETVPPKHTRSNRLRMRPKAAGGGARAGARPPPSADQEQ
jgi:eukaryotic-like serine/threonine-protein kinase